jgi:diadenosine tetraphosphatase ApaH/serine/threonine PP2A family protein phosphatase
MDERIALLADVHSNLEAFEACLAHARERGATQYAILGDIVGYGADPAAVVDRVAALRAGGAVVVKGNHDEAVAGSTSYFADAARDAIDWTRGHLDAGQRAFLDALPLFEQRGAAFFVHASAHTPQKWPYIDGSEAARRCFEAAPHATWTFAGHTHTARLYAHLGAGRPSTFTPVAGSVIPVGRHRRWLGVVGSTGQARDGNPSAAYAMFDAKAETLVFHRIAYDHERTAAKIRAAGLPAVLAWRIETGA